MAENNVYFYDDDYSYEYSHPYAEENIDETVSPPENIPDGEEEAEPVIVHRTISNRRGSVMRIVMLSLLAAAILGSVIYSLDRRNTMYNKVSYLNNELEKVESENVRLQSELESEMSAKNVEEYAENVLGMQKIDSSQIEFIKIQTGDVVYIPKQKKTIFDKVGDFFDKCAEYFKG